MSALVQDLNNGIYFTVPKQPLYSFDFEPRQWLLKLVEVFNQVIPIKDFKAVPICRDLSKQIPNAIVTITNTREKLGFTLAINPFNQSPVAL